MQITLKVQKQDEPPVLSNLREPFINFTNNEVMTFCLIQNGMSSGDPPVIIVSENHEGSVLLQTSLDKLLTAASGLAAMAEAQLGWKRPEGHYTIMPMDPGVRKQLLENLKRELEKWGDV